MNELYTQGMGRSRHLIHAIARITMIQILKLILHSYGPSIAVQLSQKDGLGLGLVMKLSHNTSVNVGGAHFVGSLWFSLNQAAPT